MANPATNIPTPSTRSEGQVAPKKAKKHGDIIPMKRGPGRPPKSAVLAQKKVLPLVETKALIHNKTVFVSLDGLLEAGVVTTKKI